MKKLRLFLIATAALAITVTTGSYSNLRLASNASEIRITPTNVVTAGFGSLCNMPADGAVMGKVLYLSAGSVSGVTANTAYFVTVNDSIYAYNADTCAAVWSVLAFDTPWTANFPETPTLFYSGKIGCMSTPVIDTANAIIYSLCANANGSNNQWKIRRHNLLTGAVLTTTVLAPTYPGTGDPNADPGPNFPGATDCVSGGNVCFLARYSICATDLTLANGNVYAACGSFHDHPPWHGWAIAYDQTTLAQAAAWLPTPDSEGGGFWMSRAGFSVDGSGNLYGFTGNGKSDGAACNTAGQYPETAVKLTSTLTLSDWYQPDGANNSTSCLQMDQRDLDLGSGRPMLIVSGGKTLLVESSKDFKVYSIDTSCMGHVGGTAGGCTFPQVFLTNQAPPGCVNALINQTGCLDQAGSYGNLYQNGIGYFSSTLIASSNSVTTPEHMYAFSLTGSSWNTTPIISAGTWQFPGALASGSSNGGSTGIIWALTVATDAHTSQQAATLRALNPSDMSQYASFTGFGNLSKFNIPTVADGHVFVGTFNSGVQVFSVLPSTQLMGDATLSGNATLR